MTAVGIAPSSQSAVMSHYLTLDATHSLPQTACFWNLNASQISLQLVQHFFFWDFWCNLDITIKFCTCTNRATVGACAKFCGDQTCNIENNIFSEIKFGFWKQNLLPNRQHVWEESRDVPGTNLLLQWRHISVMVSQITSNLFVQ